MQAFTTVLVLTLASYIAADNEKGCWRKTYGRGAGSPISTCDADREKSGLFCYSKCEEGYYGVGPVCWRTCPDGYTDIGLGCLKPGPYGRGAGYFYTSSCVKDNPDTGCEFWGLLIYPKCKKGFHNFGCCICSPDCPDEGFTDSGIACTKHSYGRGVGKGLTCTSGYEQDGLLCYKRCATGYGEAGPVCWEYCPEGMFECGALCLNSKAECTEEMTKIGVDVGIAIFEAIIDPEAIPEDIAETIAEVSPDLDVPMCAN